MLLHLQTTGTRLGGKSLFGKGQGPRKLGEGCTSSRGTVGPECGQSALGTVCPDHASGQIWDQALLILL